MNSPSATTGRAEKQPMRAGAGEGIGVDEGIEVGASERNMRQQLNPGNMTCSPIITVDLCVHLIGFGKARRECCYLPYYVLYDVGDAY